MELGEQFSLCWNNFQSNLSTGLQNLYKDEDLVDCTLAAQGHYIKAHKTVLSVCSPFFKDLFKTNPSKHPIVILPDVNYGTLCNVVHFMYQGEVSVSQEEIPSFMKVAQALKVKGLTDNTDPPNGATSTPKSALSFTTTTPIHNFQKSPPRPTSSHKKTPRPSSNSHIRNIISPRPLESPLQPAPIPVLSNSFTPVYSNSSITTSDHSLAPPPSKKQLLDPLAITNEGQNTSQYNNSTQIAIRETHTVTSSAQNTPSASPGPQAVSLVKPKEEPFEERENETAAGLEDSLTIEASTLLDTQIAEGSRSGDLSPTPQAASWPSSESLSASNIGSSGGVDDPSKPGSGVVLVKSGKGQLVLIRDGHMYTFCDQRNNQSLWVCVKKKVLNCKGCLITINSTILNTQIVLSCLAHNHSQMHDVIQRLYVTKRDGAAASTSTSPALNLCNKDAK